MRTTSVLACIEIPPHILHWNIHLINTLHKFFVTFFTNTSADYFANLREKHVSTLNRLSVFILLHIKCLDILRIVNHDDRLLEMFLHEITLMFTGKIATPGNRELKLPAVLHGIFENSDTFSIRQTHEIRTYHTLQTFDKSVVNHLVEEFKIILTIVESPLDTVLDKLFLKIHKVRKVNEANLRFNHPELSQVAWSITVFSTESRAESINLSECSSTKFTFELSTDSEGSHLAEEVVRIDNLSVFILFEIIEVLRSNLEHLAGTLTVASRNERSVEIIETLVMEELVNSNSHIVTNAEHSTECIST